ncbi:hypothetical protein O9929_22945 [Vibrio lentus]|nr:hypothetical protein [Vibrio lentus]
MRHRIGAARNIETKVHVAIEASFGAKLYEPSPLSVSTPSVPSALMPSNFEIITPRHGCTSVMICISKLQRTVFFNAELLILRTGRSLIGLTVKSKVLNRVMYHLKYQS